MKQGVEGITLCQGSYAGKILEKAGMVECNACDVPRRLGWHSSMMGVPRMLEATAPI